MASSSPVPEFDPAQLVLVGLWALYVAGWVCYSLGMLYSLLVVLIVVVLVLLVLGLR